MVVSFVFLRCISFLSFRVRSFRHYNEKVKRELSTVARSRIRCSKLDYTLHCPLALTVVPLADIIRLFLPLCYKV